MRRRPGTENAEASAWLSTAPKGLTGGPTREHQPPRSVLSAAFPMIPVGLPVHLCCIILSLLLFPFYEFGAAPDGGPVRRWAVQDCPLGPPGAALDAYRPITCTKERFESQTRGGGTRTDTAPEGDPDPQMSQQKWAFRPHEHRRNGPTVSHIFF